MSRFSIVTFLFFSLISWSQDESPVVKYIQTTTESAEYFGSNSPTLTHGSSVFEDFNEHGKVIRREFSHWREAYIVTTYDSLNRSEYEIEVNRFKERSDTTVFTHSEDTIYWKVASGSKGYQVRDEQDRTTVLYDPTAFSEEVRITYFDDYHIVVKKEGPNDSEILSYYNEHGHLVKRKKLKYAGRRDSEGNPIYVDDVEEWQYEYEFNAQGDWTKAMEYQDGYLLSRETRIIRYW